MASESIHQDEPKEGLSLKTGNGLIDCLAWSLGSKHTKSKSVQFGGGIMSGKPAKLRRMAMMRIQSWNVLFAHGITHMMKATR